MSPPALSPSVPTSPLPVTAGFAPKVSFDTFENPVASMFSYTLRVKTDGYERSRATRVFLCANSPDASGAQALDWALDALVQDGDEFVVFRGVSEDVLGESCTISMIKYILIHRQRGITKYVGKKHASSCE